MDIVTYALLNGKIKDYASNVDEWLEENVDPATGYVLDRSLQMENAAAPADMVGDINDEVGELKNTLNQLALIGNTTAINQNGTYTKENVTGMTANHKVVNWGLFSDANLTTPISPNNPPADITIAEEAGGYVITIANYTSAFYMKPTFILPQN